ncbi:MAG: glutaminyl-peptide cyclotransferase [Acidimicrobiales bacterium]
MRAAVLFVIGLAVTASACGDDIPIAEDTPTTATAEPTAGAPPTPPSDSRSPWPTELDSTHQRWTIRVVERLPHDPTAFTQGLELLDRGLLESTGRRGESSLRLVDPDAGTVIEQVALDPALFGEGLTVSGDEIIQLTWEAGRALRYDTASLEPTGEFTYDGEGWGICAADAGLWMSNGTAQLTRRDPDTFASLETVTVRQDGTPVDDLNELECIGDHVVANVWKSDEILVIEPGTGAVVATIDASALAAEVEPDDDQAVLNGIADLDDGTLLLGGKLWPTLFVVEVVDTTDG